MVHIQAVKFLRSKHRIDPVAKVIEFTALGGPDQLKLVDREIRQPAANEVQLEVKATGLNRAELLFLGGDYLVQPNLPSKIGVEGAGIVVDAGANVSNFKPGDEVCVTPNFSPDQYGTLGASAIVPVGALQPKPANVSFVEAAAFWMAYPTAYGGLVYAGGLENNKQQTVVITAASSSVGIAAIQVAKAHGAVTIATTRSSVKADQLRAVGADWVVATEEENLPQRVHDITNGKGFDVAFDPVVGPMVDLLADCVGAGGRIVAYGFLSGQKGTLPVFQLMRTGASVTAFHVVRHFLGVPDRIAASREHLMANWADGNYKPIIDKTFKLEAAAEAYSHLASNNQFGKVVIEINK